RSAPGAFRVYRFGRVPGLYSFPNRCSSGGRMKAGGGGLTVDQVNNINSGLIVVSCLLAFVLPFHLFLFAYGVLGPLHYLTEISWLHDRNYFTKGKYDWLVLVALCLPVVFGHYFAIRDGVTTAAIYLAFGGGLAMACIKSVPLKGMALLLLLL